MKVFSTILALALGLWICGTASAAPQDLRSPDQVAPALTSHQDLRSPDQVAPALAIHQDLRNPDRFGPERSIVTGVTKAPAPVAALNDAIPAPDAGLSTLLIVLIATGGAVAVAGAGYATGRHVAHTHGHGTT
jgi:hypothetical protein